MQNCDAANTHALSEVPNDIASVLKDMHQDCYGDNAYEVVHVSKMLEDLNVCDATWTFMKDKMITLFAMYPEVMTKLFSIRLAMDSLAFEVMKLDPHKALPSFLGAINVVVMVVYSQDFVNVDGNLDEGLVATLFETLKKYPNKVNAYFNDVPIDAKI